MKYNIKHRLLALSLVVVLLLPSCKKQLDNPLHNATYANTFWKSRADMEAAMSGSYQLLRTICNNGSAFIIWGDAPSGTLGATNGVTDNGWIFEGVTKSGAFKTPYYQGLLHNWSEFFKIIAVANIAIDKAQLVEGPSVTQEIKDNWQGEAYFLRALSYFMMTRIWGDVPLELKPIYAAEEITLNPREAAGKIIDQAIADAKVASGLMSWETADEYGRSRASKGAAFALLAHLTAWKGDYANTVVYTDSLIKATDYYELEGGDSYSNIFSSSSDSKENIFILRQSRGFKESEWGGIGRAVLADPYVKDATEFFFVSDYTLDLYDNADLRYEQFFGTSTKNHTLLLKYNDVGYVNTVNNTDPYVQSNIIFFRLADMYLLKAEALANLGGNDAMALAAMKVVRDRAGAENLDPVSGISLKYEILYERQRELVGEGQTYYDQIRTKLYPSWLVSDPSRIALKGWLWPIANNLFNNNKVLTQNEYWKGKY